MGDHCLREDVAEVLARATGRALSAADSAALLRCFLLDASGTIGWPEFEQCWRALQQLGISGNTGGGSAAAARLRKRAGVGAAPQQRPQQQRVATSQVGLEEGEAHLPLLTTVLLPLLALHNHNQPECRCHLSPPCTTTAAAHGAAGGGVAPRRGAGASQGAV